MHHHGLKCLLIIACINYTIIYFYKKNTACQVKGTALCELYYQDRSCFTGLRFESGTSETLSGYGNYYVATLSVW